MRLRILGLSTIAVLALVSSLRVFAQQVTFSGAQFEASAVPTAPPVPMTVRVPGDRLPDWGTSAWIAYTVGPCDAMVRGGTWVNTSCTDVQSTSASDLYVGFPVHIPTGANAQYVDLAYNETDAGAPISAGLWAIGQYGSMSLITDMSPAATAGGDITTQWGPFSAVINNDDVGGNNYVVLAIVNGSTQIYKATVFYKLQVSPAPGAATFTDVPTNYWAFQYIEALAASGITAGCGAGTFCPEQYVRRSEMAVFLAKALGLHWEY